MFVRRSLISVYLCNLVICCWFDNTAACLGRAQGVRCWLPGNWIAPTINDKLPIRQPYRLDALQWRHNGHDGVSNHQPHHCLLNRLFGCRSKKTSKLRVTGLCVGNSPGTGASLYHNGLTMPQWAYAYECIVFVNYRDNYCRQLCL